MLCFATSNNSIAKVHFFIQTPQWFTFFRWIFWYTRILIFRKSGFVRRHTIAQRDFGRTYADYRISGEKGFASRLNRSLDWWCKAHFFFAYAREVLLRISDDFSFFTVHLSRKRKAVHDRPLHEWNKPSPTAGKPERMILYLRPDMSCRRYKTILSTR